MKRFFKGLKGSYIALVLLFLYSPIAIMIILSFNEGKSRANWQGFSLKWYASLLDNSKLMDALEVTLIVAFAATLASVVLGTLGAIGIHACKKKYSTALINLSYLPMTMPDIVTGVSLMMMMVFINKYLFTLPRGMFQMDPNLRDAALDLGCTPMEAITDVIIPEIKPGIITGALLALTMSLDDFVISYFTGGYVQNLSVVVYSAAKLGVTPDMYAMSTIMFVTVLTLLIVVNKRSTLESIS